MKDTSKKEGAQGAAQASGWRPRTPPRESGVLPSRGALRVVGLRVDGLKLGCVVRLDAARLAAWRACAVPEGEDARPGRGVIDVPLTDWAGERSSVQLAVNVQRGDRFVFRNADLRGLLDEHPLAGCAVDVTFSSSFLSTNGLEAAIEYARAVASTVGEVIELRTRRLDLAADVEGWIFVDGDRDSWVKPGRAGLSGWAELPDADSKIREHGTTKITGYTVAPGGAILCRAYDKREELAKKSPEKAEGEEVIWRSNGWQGGAVARCEFQLRSEALRSFGVVDPIRIAESLDALWSYLVTRWCRMVLPGTSTRRGRCALDPRWELLQAIRFRHESYPAARRYFRGGATVAQSVGCALSLVAHSTQASEIVVPAVPDTEDGAVWALAELLNSVARVSAEVAHETLTLHHHGARGALAWLADRARYTLARASTVGGGALPPRRSRPSVELWRKAA